jgi:hypothetical protein
VQCRSSPYSAIHRFDGAVHLLCVGREGNSGAYCQKKAMEEISLCNVHNSILQQGEDQ